MTREVRVSIPGRIVYVTGTVNGLLYVFTADGGKWMATVARSENDVYEVSLTAIDDAGKEGHYTTTVYYGAQLITDRTEQDVIGKTPKGFYNASDLNRVGYAVKFLSDLLVEYGYTAGVQPRTDWTMTDFPAAEEMERYLDNVRVLMDAYCILPTTPPLPESMEKLGYKGANAIEQILVDMHFLIINMAATWFYAGDLYAGEV